MEREKDIFKYIRHIHMYKYLFIHSLNLPFHLPLGPITYPKKKKSFIHISLLACVTREKEEKEKDIGEREREIGLHLYAYLLTYWHVTTQVVVC